MSSTDKLLKLIQQKNAMRSGGALPLPKAQTGTPTFADSLALYNNALDKIKFYSNNPDYRRVLRRNSTNFLDDSTRKDLINALKDENFITNQDKKVTQSLINQVIRQTASSRKPLTAAEKKQLQNKLGKTRFGKVPNTGLYSYGDILTGTPDTYYNPLAPPIYLHPNIKPHGSETYASKRFQDTSEVPYYEPVLVKPESLLTPEEAQKRNRLLNLSQDIPLMQKKGIPNYIIEEGIPQKVKVQTTEDLPFRKTEFYEGGLGTVYEIKDEFNNWIRVPQSTYNQVVQQSKKQDGGPIMNPYMPGVPMATGAVEPTMGPVEMLLLPSQLPIRAATALGRGALLAAEALNPISGLKPTPGMMYRGIGKEGFEDAMKSGVLRPQQHGYAPGRSIREILSSPKQFGSTYFTPHLDIAKKYGKTHVAVTPKTEEFLRRYGRKDWSWSIGRQLPLNEVELYKKNLVGAWRKTKQDGGQENLEYVPSPGSTYGNYYDPSTGEYIPQVYLKDVDIVADKELPFQNGKFAPFLAARGTADYVPVESMLLPGTPAIKGLSKATNFAIDALNPLAGMRGLKPKASTIDEPVFSPAYYESKAKLDEARQRLIDVYQQKLKPKSLENITEDVDALNESLVPRSQATTEDLQSMLEKLQEINKNIKQYVPIDPKNKSIDYTGNYGPLATPIFEGKYPITNYPSERSLLNMQGGYSPIWHFNQQLAELRGKLQFGNPKLEKPLYDPNLTRSIQDNLAEDALLRSWWQKEQMLQDPLSQTTTVQGQPFTFSPRAFESKRKMQDFSNPFGGKEAWRLGINPNKLGGLTKHQSKGVVNNKLYDLWYKYNTPEGRAGLPDSYSDYDYKSYFRDAVTGKNPMGYDEESMHFPDTYKYPWHPSFSDESIYYTNQKETPALSYNTKAKGGPVSGKKIRVKLNK